MNAGGSLFFAILGSCLALAAAWPSPASAQDVRRLSGVVSHVADGDTIDIHAGELTYRIRLDGIDAPEGGQAFSARSRQALRVLCFSQPATAVVKTTDRYGRLVARVTVRGRDLSEEMVAAGMAWHFLRYSSDPRLASLEKQARDRRLGLWTDRAPIPPWDYRTARARPAPAAPAIRAPAVAPSVLPGASTGPFHGNVRSRVFHAPGCRDYDCRNCTAVFGSAEQAKAGGYRPHGTCVLSR